MYAKIEGGKGHVVSTALDKNNYLDGFIDSTVYTRPMTNQERRRYGLPEIITKVCKRCGEGKPITDFGKDKSKQDGLNIYCKKCCRKKQRR